MTGNSKENAILKQIFYIYYLVWFKNNKVWALINSGGKFNTMTLIYAAMLGLKVFHTNAGAQKIDGFTFKTFGIVLISFQVGDKLKKA